MTTKYILPSSFRHIFGGLAVCSFRNNVLFCQKSELLCQIFAQRETPETFTYTHHS